MSGTISTEENLLVSGLKKLGILKRFNPEKEMKDVAKNGGVAIICADGDIDAGMFHRRISHRPHTIQLFGGPLLFAPSFGGYDAVLAKKLIENIKQGMEVKKTKTLYLYFHSPCGMATAHSHSISDVIEMARSVNGIFSCDQFFHRVFVLFHVKRINRGGELEQNTYIIL